MQQVMVRLPPELYAQIKEIARGEDRGVAQTIRRALRQYCEAAVQEVRPEEAGEVLHLTEGHGVLYVSEEEAALNVALNAYLNDVRDLAR